jgi:hypothetical protein
LQTLIDKVNKVTEKIDEVKSEQQTMRLEQSNLLQLISEVNNKYEKLNQDLLKLSAKQNSVMENMTEMTNKSKINENELSGLASRITQVESNMAFMKSKIDSNSPLNKPFDPEVTVVAVNLPAIDETSNSLLSTCKDMMNKVLGENTEIINCKRVGNTENRMGIVKIQLASTDIKKSVLKRKHLLRQHARFQNIYLRSSYSDNERKVYRNLKTIMQQLPQLTFENGIVKAVDQFSVPTHQFPRLPTHPFPSIHHRPGMPHNMGSFTMMPPHPGPNIRLPPPTTFNRMPPSGYNRMKPPGTQSHHAATNSLFNNQ